MKDFIKLAIVTTHPIQYYAPLFKLLTERNRIQIKVFYTWEQAQRTQYDPGFGKTVVWDVPLLEGYAYAFVKNTARQPGSHRFRGIVNATLPREVADWGAHAVLVFGWSYHSHLAVMRHFKGKIPVFFRGDSTLLNERPGAKQLLRRVWLTWVYRHIDAAFYVGTNNRAYYRKHAVKESALVFAPHAIDNARFEQNAVADEHAAQLRRQALGIAEGSVVFLFAGKLEPTKSPRLLLEAFLEARLPRAHLVVVGNGVLENELKARADGQPNVHFLDFQNQSQMPVIYRLADVFVLPSRGETWGLAVNEAMACGRPVLVSDQVGCAVDLVKEGQNGYVFPSGDVESLGKRLESMAENAGQLAGMRKKSLEIIQNWSFDAACTGIEKGVIGLL